MTMAVTSPTYCTREDVQDAADIRPAAGRTDAIDRAIMAATDTVDALTVRRFLPVYATRRFDWPNDSGAPSWRLWLDGAELLGADTIDSGGTSLTAQDFYLEPNRTGPPFTYIEINRGGPGAWSAGSSPQRSVAITGTWGYRDDSIAAGTLADAADADDGVIELNDSAAVGVGALLRIGSERLLVTDRSMVDSGDVLGGDLTVSAAGTAVPVTSGSGFSAGEVIAVDAERMLITQITGNSLAVRRGWDGTALAAHTSGAAVYVGRRFTVARGATGTTAAAHGSGSSVRVCAVPAAVRQLAIAEAAALLGGEAGGWSASTSAAGSDRRQTGPGALDALRQQVRRLYGRRARVRAV